MTTLLVHITNAEGAKDYVDGEALASFSGKLSVNGEESPVTLSLRKGLDEAVWESMDLQVGDELVLTVEPDPAKADYDPTPATASATVVART